MFLLLQTFESTAEPRRHVFYSDSFFVPSSLPDLNKTLPLVGDVSVYTVCSEL